MVAVDACLLYLSLLLQQASICCLLLVRGRSLIRQELQDLSTLLTPTTDWSQKNPLNFLNCSEEEDDNRTILTD